MITPDPFEQKLSSLHPRALPPEWRAEILGRAAVAGASQPRVKGPPRWLAWGWGAGIAASLLLHFATPEDPASVDSTDHLTALPRADIIHAWLAYNHSDAYLQP
ncbi:MAG: hypothetical protein U0984_00675 [Prosthecobacter sp.]|nr:hypothetical protein [Prosthecobacter sp.]